MQNKDTVVIEFNQSDLDEYIKYYFKMKPRCKKPPIDSPMVRSLNKMLVITNRIVQNNWKQNWKDYSMWLVNKYGLTDLGISSADMSLHLTFPTKARRDLDNFISKEVLDGFVESGLIVDDSYFYIHSIKTTAEYQKGITKMIFTFSNCKYDLEDLRATQEKEKHRKEAKAKTIAAKPKKSKSKAKKK